MTKATAAFQQGTAHDLALDGNPVQGARDRSGCVWSSTRTSCVPYWPQPRGRVRATTCPQSERRRRHLLQELPARSGMQSRRCLARCTTARASSRSAPSAPTSRGSSGPITTRSSRTSAHEPADDDVVVQIAESAAGLDGEQMRACLGSGACEREARGADRRGAGPRRELDADGLHQRQEARDRSVASSPRSSPSSNRAPTAHARPLPAEVLLRQLRDHAAEGDEPPPGSETAMKPFRSVPMAQTTGTGITAPTRMSTV